MPHHRDTLARQVLRQVHSPANVILLVAVCLSLVVSVHEGHAPLEPAVILAIVAANVALAVGFERRAVRDVGGLAGEVPTRSDSPGPDSTQRLQPPMRRRLVHVIHVMSAVAAVGALALLVLELHGHEDAWAIALVAASLAVAAVPEVLLLIVTLTLRRGARELGRAGALVRRLSLVETLGSVSVLCVGDSGLLPSAESARGLGVEVLSLTGGEKDRVAVVRAWQERGRVVALVGAAPQDVAALGASDVGVAPEGACPAARAVAEVVLSGSDLAPVLAAMRSGRDVFLSVRRTVSYLLVSNLSEVAVMVLAALVGWPVPLTPVTLLLINLVGDGVPGVFLARDREGGSPAPQRREEGYFSPELVADTAQQAVAFTVVGMAAYALGAFVWLPGGPPPSVEAGASMCFLVMALTSVLHAFTVRTRDSVLRRTVADNKSLVAACVGVAVLFSTLVLVEPLAEAFGLVVIGVADLAACVALALVPVLVHEAAALRRR